MKRYQFNSLDVVNNKPNNKGVFRPDALSNPTTGGLLPENPVERGGGLGEYGTIFETLTLFQTVSCPEGLK